MSRPLAVSTDEIRRSPAGLARFGSDPSARRWAPAADRMPGTAGQLVCLAFSLLAATLAPGWRVALVCGVTLCLGAAFHRAGLKPLLSGRVWLFLLFLLAPAALLAGPADWTVAGLSSLAAGAGSGGADGAAGSGYPDGRVRLLRLRLRQRAGRTCWRAPVSRGSASPWAWR